MSRRGRAWVVAALVLTVLTVAAAVLAPIPFVVRSPGPVFDILGTVDDKPVLEIAGAPSYPTTGVLDMTTVAESGGPTGAMNVGTALVGLVTSDASVLPDLAPERDRSLDEAVFDASQSQALGAAARYLDRPVRSAVMVQQVSSGSASDGQLEAGDRIVRIDGHPVRDRGQVVEQVSGQPPGTRFTIVVRRDGQPRRVTVVSRPDPDDPQRGLIGIVLTNAYFSDFTATVNLDGIGGPSAGTMLALGMIDKLTPGDLLAGHTIAGTGTIDGDGLVGPIGGIDKKMLAAQAAGAQLFLAPADNCPEVVDATPDGLTVVPVARLGQAVTAIEDWKANRPVPGCPGAGVE